MDTFRPSVQIRCVMETYVITIYPPLQSIDIGNGCEAYSTSIYILAKLELTANMQFLIRSQFFLDCNHYIYKYLQRYGQG